MARKKWTAKALALLTEHYLVETISDTAAMTGMCETSVKDMARKLGLCKAGGTKISADMIQHVQQHFHEHSVREIADELGISSSSVNRIKNKLGLRKTVQQKRDMHSRVRSEIIRRERRRAIFGLNPITRIKVVTNRARIQLRCKLKSLGYIVSRTSNVLYYTAGLERRDILEANGQKLGLSFLPYPAEEESLLVTAI